MDAIVKNFPVLDNASDRPTQKEAEDAVRVLLRWAGDDPSREGLLDTPARVAKSYRELFSGYDLAAEDVLGRTFEEVAGYDDMVLVKDIPFYSHCEHHMVPIIGKGARRLSAEWKGSWAFEDRPRGRYLWSPAADAGIDDGPDRQGDRRVAGAPRGRGDDRG